MSAINVVKIGGSLAETPLLLQRVLAILTEASVPIAVVPGGGPFAEAVRTAQAAMGYSDVAAHRMAILAMHQMAEVLVERLPRAQAVMQPAEVAFCAEAGMIPVWLPLDEIADVPELPPSWSVTSDAIAAWLAMRIGAAQLLLVKACAVPREAAPEDLADMGIIDSEAARLIAAHGIAATVLGEGDEAALAGLLRSRRVGSVMGAAKGRP